MTIPKVLMVAEKPSLAQAIAGILSHGQATSHRRALEVHEFQGKFQGQNAQFMMTSVIGHVFSIDFLPRFQSWENTDPKDLFHAGTKKSEANPKHALVYSGSELVSHRSAQDESTDNTDTEVPAMSSNRPQRFVWRAKFSAISAPEITSAIANLGEPNENEALAVDARQELDLKVGVAFTRYQTRFFQGKYGNLDANVISYGPCQTPTLNFAVEQHQRIVSFVPEPYWSVVVSCIRSSGQKIALEWSRSRVFMQDVGRLLLARVQKAGSAAVTSFSKDEGRKQRPHGLNTVALLKVASSSFNIGPQRAMQVAEALYTQGYLSYPRTESSAYPPNFDFSEILRALCGQPVWGEVYNKTWKEGSDESLAILQELQQDGFKRPQGGQDMGDHPPITPVAAATEAELGGGDEWRIYDYIARHFLGSLCPDCVYQKSKATLQAGGEVFTASGTVLIKAGFTAIMPWAAPSMSALPELKVGEKLPLKDIELRPGKTSPPDHLTEADLIGLMEQHGIGTDASISVHVHNVCERGYVRVEAGRRVIPTDLGITLISGYQRIDPELCRPQVRAHVESQIALIAAGKADKSAVVDHTLQQFLSKFLFFSENIARMDVLFEANFAPLTASGKPLSLCGKCKRYMRYISAQPARLFCPTCEEIYSLPQRGDIKLYSGAVCPLDSFELVTFTLGGMDGKRYALCPFCYNHPPFEDLAKSSGEAGKQGATLKTGMPCTQCAHPTCKHGFARMGVMACPDCEEGTIVLDPGSHPRWRLDCNRCNHLVYLPPDLHTVKVTATPCEDCGSKHLQLTFRKGHVPEAFPGGDEAFEACIVCDDRVLDLCEYKHGNARPRYKGRGGGRGRGRGRGRRGRGRRTDAKMTFHGF